MHKLVILVGPLADMEVFDDMWPNFLHLAEQMPGLKRETTSRAHAHLYGECEFSLIHELYFDSLAELQAAMGSTSGRAAGEMLQRMTGGNVTLLLTDHTEDELENIRKFQNPGPQA